MNKLEEMPFLADNPVFQYLASVADISALSQGERLKYDESSKIMRGNKPCPFCKDIHSPFTECP